MTMQRFRVAVIGAGAVGLAVARALALEGIDGVVVLDSNDAPGLGSTSRAAGGMRAQWSLPINIQLSGYTIDEFTAIKASTGELRSFVQAGYLITAGTPAGAQYLERAHTIQEEAGVDAQLLTPDQALEMAPYLRRDGLLAASYRAADSLFDPHEIATVLWRQAQVLGVQGRYSTSVAGISVVDKGFELLTPSGNLECDWLVNAAGPSAAQVGQMLGVEVPVQPYRRNVAVTEAITGLPEVMPMCVDLDTGLVTRREGPGCAVMWSDPAEPSSFSIAFDPDYLLQIAQRVGNRFPFLESAKIDTRKCWAGLYPETVDYNAIIGPTPGHAQFLQCCGFGGHGVMQCLGAGKAIAEIVTHGRCETFNIHPLRLSRFKDGELFQELGHL